MPFCLRPRVLSLSALVLVLAGLAACASPTPTIPPPPGIELVGHRALAMRFGRPVHWFDAGARPVVRVPDAEGHVVDWIGADGHTLRLEHRVESSDDWTFLVTTTAPAPGPGELRLRADDRDVARWPAVWKHAPERLGESAADGPDPMPADDVELWAPVARARQVTGFAEAEAAWLAAADVAERMAVPTETARRLCAAAFKAMGRSAFDAAGAHLARAAAAAGGDARAVALVAHTSAVLAQNTARWRDAEARLVAGSAAAERARATVLIRFFLQSRALLALDLGDHRQAVTLIDRLLLDPGPEPVERARAALNAGYIYFRAMVSGAIPIDLTRVRALFAQAEAVSSERDTAAHLYVNRALVELFDARCDPAYDGSCPARQRARWDAAAEHLSLIDDGGEGTEVAAVASVAFGQLEQARGRWVAADGHYAAAERAAVRWWGEDGGDYGWRADLGLGQTAHARGELRAAAQHFDRARARLERLAASTDPLAHRVAFFADRDALARSTLAVALERDDLEAAFTTVDRNQGRVLRSMLWTVLGSRSDGAESQRWSQLQAAIARSAATVKALEKQAEGVSGDPLRGLDDRLRRARRIQRSKVDAAVDFLDARLPQTRLEPADVRASLAHDESILAVGRHDGGRVALWASRDGYQASPLPEPLSDDRLPEPPWPTRHLYVVAGGHPDVVRAAFQTAVDRPYSVSLLPVAELLAAPRRRPSGAPVVLADPTGELPEARREGAWLAQALPGARLHTLEAADRPALQAALETARLVHFSGHGELSLDRPWTSHLVLAGGVRFDVFDVLSTTGGGGLAVLNGCETGADALSTRDDVLGLPEALLVAGATAVVAADRTLPDADARRFSELFYIHGGHRQPGPALQATMRALRDDGIPTWDAWRLVGRPIVEGPETGEDSP